MGVKKVEKIVDDFMKGVTTEDDFKKELESSSTEAAVSSIDLSSEFKEAKELVKDIRKSNEKLRVI